MGEFEISLLFEKGVVRAHSGRKGFDQEEKYIVYGMNAPDEAVFGLRT